MDEPETPMNAEDAGDGHDINLDSEVLDALKDKQEQGAGAKVEVPTNPPAPVKPAAVESSDPSKMAWFLAERDVQKSCQDLDAEDIELLKAASGGDPVKFVLAAEKQQAKRAALKAPKPENEDDVAKRRVAEEIFGPQGPGGSSEVRPKPPSPAEKVKQAAEKGDTRGLIRATADVFNAGKDGKPMFDGVRMQVE